MNKIKKQDYAVLVFELLNKKIKPSLQYHMTSKDGVIEFYYMGNLSNGLALIYRNWRLEVIKGIDPSGDLIFDDVYYSYFWGSKYNISDRVITDKDLVIEACNIIKEYSLCY